MAVLFTFSFSTAFAADPVQDSTSTYLAKLAQAETELATQLGAAREGTVKGLADNYTEEYDRGKNITIAKSVYEKVAADVYKDYMNVLSIAANELETAYQTAAAPGGSGTSSEDAMSFDDVKSALLAHDVATTGAYVSMSLDEAIDPSDFSDLVLCNDVKFTYLPKTLEYAFPAEKDRVIGELNKVDLSLYSDDVMDPVNDAYQTTYAKFAQDTRDELISDANDITIQSGAALVDLQKAITDLNDLITNNLTAVDYALDGATPLTYEIKNANLVIKDAAGTTISTTPLKTKKALGQSDTTLEAAKLSAKAEAQQNAATFYQDALTAYGYSSANKAVFDKAVKEKDAYLEVVNTQIDEAKAVSAIRVRAFNYNSFGATGAPFTGKSTPYTNLVNAYNDLADYAAIAKNMVEKTGVLKYDAAKIDSNLADAKVAIYTSMNANAASQADIVKDAENEAEDVDWAKKVAIATLEDDRDGNLYAKDGSDNYYDIEKAKIEAKYQEVIDKVNAATTIAQVDQVKAAPSIATIKDKGDTVTAIQTLSKFNDEMAKVQAYVDYMNSGINSWEDGYRTFTAKDLATFYAEKGARTNEEIQALLNDAKAMVEALPTKKQTADAKKALEDAIKALPNAITLADKEAVKAAYDTREESGITPDNNNRLNAAITAVQNAEKKAIDKQFEALPSLANVTAANKDAVKAIADAISAYDSTAMYPAVYDAATPTKLKKYQDAVRDAEMKVVMNQIATLPADATKAQIEAARAAYDAFVQEYTDPLDNYDARDVINIDKLLYAEAQLATQELADVESLKITASSKAAKGSMTIKWRYTGNAAAADGFRIYRSTKPNSGYKLYFDTKSPEKTQYKNTKNLKKGRTYYYKVRAYKVVDGKTYFSDFSNKAYRKAK